MVVFVVFFLQLIVQPTLDNNGLIDESLGCECPLEPKDTAVTAEEVGLFTG